MPNGRELVLVVALTSAEPAPGKVLLTSKFLEGMRSYVERWDGPVHAILPPGSGRTGNLDDIVCDRADLPFTVDVLPLDSPALRRRLLRASVVMGQDHPALSDLAEFCRQAGVPYVFNCEYNLRTRLEIARIEARSLLRRLCRDLWARKEEVRLRRTVRAAAAVQCNGHPAFEAYRGIARDIVLYYDNRIEAGMLASAAEVEAKLERHASRRLALVYSGRLSHLKGAGHLVPLARSLREQGIEFDLHICGDGELQAGIAREIAAAGLQACVHLCGMLDFQTELVPFVTRSADLFVCLHPQGDPACTYLETFACGVPILGYANEAFAGLQRESRGGWVTPVGEVRAVARSIAALARDRRRLREPALAALSFAREHTFPMEFDRRVAQLERCAR